MPHRPYTPRPATPATPARTAHTSTPQRRWGLVALPLVGAGVLAAAWAIGTGQPAQQPTWTQPALLQAAVQNRAGPAAALPVDSRPMLPASTAAAGHWPLMVAAATGGLPQPVAELAGRVGPSAGLWLAPQLLGDWAEGLQRLQTGPGLLVLRYDALRAARAANAALVPPLLTPLYVEPLLAIVRNTAPTATLQQLRGLRVRTAAAGTADALSASALLQALFGAAAPAVLHAAAGNAAALPQSDDEVLLTVGRAGRPWTDAVPAGLQRQYRLLAWADSGGAGALQQHLPLLVDGPDGPVKTLGMMSFLAVSPASASSHGDGPALLRLAEALCRELPALQRSGDAAWRGWQPGLQLTTGWPTVQAAAPAWRQCDQLQASASRIDPLLADASRTDPRLADASRTDPRLADASHSAPASDSNLVSTTPKAQP